MSSAASSSLGKRWTASSGYWIPIWPTPSCRGSRAIHPRDLDRFRCHRGRTDCRTDWLPVAVSCDLPTSPTNPMYTWCHAEPAHLGGSRPSGGCHSGQGTSATLAPTLEGLLVQRMARRSGGLELRIRLQQDRFSVPSILLLGEPAPSPRMVPFLPQPGTGRYQIIGAFRMARSASRPVQYGSISTPSARVLCQLSRAAAGLPRDTRTGSAPAAGLWRRDGDPGCPARLGRAGQQVLPLAIRPHPTRGGWKRVPG